MPMIVFLLKSADRHDTRTQDMFGNHVETKTRKDGVVQKYHVGSGTVSMPRAEAVKEHERLVQVLESPSHADDKAEAKRQKKELEGYKAGPNEADKANPRKKYYVTMFREGIKRPAILAGPFDRHEDALSHVDLARKEAEKADPRAVFDAFGTSGIESDNHPPGVLNERLGLGMPPRKQPKVTPQVPSKRQIDGMIGIAADSIEKLRRADVDRVIGEAPAHFRLALASHIKDSRRDLADEVDSVMSELAGPMVKSILIVRPQAS